MSVLIPGSAAAKAIDKAWAEGRIRPMNEAARKNMAKMVHPFNRPGKGAAMVRSYLDMIENEIECSRCGYFESAPRHTNKADRDYHEVVA